MNRDRIGVGLYGGNGHQVSKLLENCPWGEVVGYAEFELPAGSHSNAVRHTSLDELLKDPQVQLVSLCSPRRVDQVSDAIACLKAGKHVYAEKPAAFTNESLDEILVVSKASGCEFHEMADTIIRQPYFALRELVRAGRLGEVVQVWAQKSYPLSIARRPQDEDVDGGLIRQCAIHSVRMIEHLTGLAVTSVEAIETSLGNSRGGGLRTAASLQLALENGGIGSVVANYWNPAGFGRHGNDQVRIFGTLGTAEITDDAQRSRLIVGDRDFGTIEANSPVEPFLHSYLKKLLGLGEMPMSLEEELRPLRVVNRAKQAAKFNAIQSKDGASPL